MGKEKYCNQSNSLEEKKTQPNILIPLVGMSISDYIKCIKYKMGGTCKNRKPQKMAKEAVKL